MRKIRYCWFISCGTGLGLTEAEKLMQWSGNKPRERCPSLQFEEVESGWFKGRVGFLARFVESQVGRMLNGCEEISVED